MAAEPPEIRAGRNSPLMLGWDSMRVFGFSAWYLSEPSSQRGCVLKRKFDILIIERMSDFTTVVWTHRRCFRAMKSKVPDFFNENAVYTDEPTSQLHLIIEKLGRTDEENGNLVLTKTQ